MFTAAGLKSVGRAELQSPASSPRSSPDPAITDLLRARVQAEFAFASAEDYPPEELEDDEEAELILFAAPSSRQQTHKIRLASPDAGSGEPGFLVKKPRSYYFADEVTSEKEIELGAAAVTGETVMAMSRVAWPGCALPWKVQTITSAGLKSAVLVGHPPTVFEVQEKLPRRSRKSKKSRIALRKKTQATKGKVAERTRLAHQKEEAEREKRTRRNREKKVKKKAREKAKKTTDGNIEAASEKTTDGAD